MVKELDAAKLRRTCDPSAFAFDTTAEIDANVTANAHATAHIHAVSHGHSFALIGEQRDKETSYERNE